MTPACGYWLYRGLCRYGAGRTVYNRVPRYLVIAAACTPPGKDCFTRPGKRRHRMDRCRVISAGPGTGDREAWPARVPFSCFA